MHRFLEVKCIAIKTNSALVKICHLRSITNENQNCLMINFHSVRFPQSKYFQQILTRKFVLIHPMKKSKNIHI